MAASNAKVSDLLRRYASALVLEGVDRFKVKAYRRAADTIETLSEDVAKLVARGGDLESLPGVGSAISAKILEIVNTGKLPQLDRTLANLKPELVELATRPALDPKQVMRVYKKLGINNLADLKKRLDKGEIRESLGARVDYHIRQGLDDRPRILLWNAEDTANRVEKYLQAIPGVTQVARVGSLRRKQETVGDLNFLVSGKNKAAILKAFMEFGSVQSKTLVRADTTRFKLADGRSVTLMMSNAAAWGLNLLMSTGSDAHLVDLRSTVKKGGLGLKALGKAGADEVQTYKKLGLAFIAPELREGTGEVAAAQRGELPQLVELKDLHGDLHMHTTASDGANSIEEMAEAARQRGYQYIAITDHSQSLKITNGLTEKRLLQHIKAIDKLNAKLKSFTILKSAEVDILADGSLDYSNAILKKLDLTICSIHSRFALSSQLQTERIMRAMDNPYFNILGHATGRLLLKREGYDPNIERLIEHAAQTGSYFEINSSPDRLDLSDENARMAKDAGIKIAINTDAHSIRELDFIHGGLNQARRAWLEPTDVLNAYPLAKLKKLLAR